MKQITLGSNVSSLRSSINNKNSGHRKSSTLVFLLTKAKQKGMVINRFASLNSYEMCNITMPWLINNKDSCETEFRRRIGMEKTVTNKLIQIRKDGKIHPSLLLHISIFYIVLWFRTVEAAGRQKIGCLHTNLHI